MKEFAIENIRVLHLEITTRCNAACPQCMRTIHADTLVQAELSLADVKMLFPVEFVKQLDKVLLCGSFGDPAAARHTLPVLRWMREVNPNIVIGINTNGGIRSAGWWGELGALLSNPRDYVVFSIDGLEDTNHIYRINVRWPKLIDNVKSFINAGGSAHWDMLVYKHNEHQVDAAAKLAKDLGFSWFRHKVTRREISVTFLQLPAMFSKPVQIAQGRIKCHAYAEESIYVSASGHLLPCCMIGANIAEKDFEKESGLLFNSLDLRSNTIEQVLATFSVITDTWGYKACISSCTVTPNDMSNFSNQWRGEIELSKFGN